MNPVRAAARSPRSSLPDAPHPRLGRLLWQWLALGLLMLALLPVTRGQHAWLGSGPFWLLLAPLSSLLVFHRHAVAAAWRGILVPAPRRRPARAIGRQARRPALARSGRRSLRAA